MKKLKWPWRELEDRTAKAVVNLKEILEAKIKKAVEVQHAAIMGQMSIFKSSEQIKYNRHDRRLQDLEGACDELLEAYYKKLDDRDKAAAAEVDKSLV